MSKWLLRLAAPAIALCISGSLAAQPVYRCEVNGKVIYSHDPCLDAKVVDTTPTQGLDKSSGVSRKGADVRRSELNKAMADAWRPLLNEKPEERERRLRRAKLASVSQQECAKLDPLIAAEPGKRAPEDQAAVFQHRKRYRELGC